MEDHKNEIGTNILRIHPPLMSVGSTVLSNSTEYNKLEIKGQKIGNSITEIVIDNPLLVGCEYEMQILGHLVCVKKLTINSMNSIKTIPLSFYLTNKELEIEINCEDPISDFDLCVFESNNINRDLYINPKFMNILQYCTSFKRILFPCRLPYNEASVMEVIGYLNFNYLKVDEILIDFNGFSSHSYCYIRKMEIEIVKERNQHVDEIMMKAIVKVIDFGVNFDNNLLPNDIICFFEHKICLSKTVTSVIFEPRLDFYCDKCWKFMIRSFPNIKYFKKYYTIYSKPSTIILMSKNLPHLIDLRVFYNKSLALWPCFKQLKSLSITLLKYQSPDEMLHLCKQCQNLEKFTIQFLGDRFPPSEKILESIAKNLLKLRMLCCNLKIGRESFKVISDNLKHLKKLSFGCNENTKDLFELFENLPELELIEYHVNKQNFYKNLIRKDCEGSKSVRKENLLNIQEETNLCCYSVILPEEIWAKVFRTLNYNEQVRCRSVCVSWRHILSTYPRFSRAIELGYCVLARDSNPVKTFVDTQFNYNILSLEGPIRILNSNLNEFWHHLGKTIDQIYIGHVISWEMWLQLVHSGMTVRNLPHLESITFIKPEIFADLLNNCFEAIAPVLVKAKKLEVSGSKIERWHKPIVCPDMLNLEYVKLHGENYDIAQCISSNCRNMHTLDILVQLPTDFASMFTQAKYLTFRKHRIGSRDIEFIINHCGDLKSLTLHQSHFTLNVLDFAKRLYKHILKITDLLFYYEYANDIYDSGILSHKSTYNCKYKFKRESEDGFKLIEFYCLPIFTENAEKISTQTIFSTTN